MKREINAALSRIRAIAKRYDLVEAAEVECRYFAWDAENPVELAQAVCAVAQTRLADKDEAMQLADIVWRAFPRDERHRLMLRRTALGRVESEPYGDFDVVGFRQEYAKNLNDVIVILRCRNCGMRIERRWHAVTNYLCSRFCPACSPNYRQTAFSRAGALKSKIN